MAVILLKPGPEASRIRRSIWADIAGSCDALPVDPIRIADAMGIDVFEDDTLGPHVSGAISKDPGEDPVIILNSADSKNRRRFTCAHEIGHFVLQKDARNYEYIDFRDEASSSGQLEEERFANQFAAALLMPEALVTKMVDEGSSTVEMAYRFGVSQEAMSYRIDNLRLSNRVR
jgi:Zn-dependent peptidase ImmA (M78 family)